MKKLQKLEKFRIAFLKEISNLTPDQLNKIPDGFHNNIIWNLAHVVAASQMIFYRRAGLSLTIDDQYITPFLTGTKPISNLRHEEIINIKEIAIRTIVEMQADFEQNIFTHYIKSENIERVYGIEILTIEDALEFLLYHEGYHMGKVITLKQFV